MQLSRKAKEDLRKILETEVGEKARDFSDEDINNFGVRLLKMTATVIKHKTALLERK